MEPYEKLKKVTEFINQQFDPTSTTTDFYKDLNNLLYTYSELGGWADCIDSVSAEQAIQCWRIVESLRTKEFPQELRM